MIHSDKTPIDTILVNSYSGKKTLESLIGVTKMSYFMNFLRYPSPGKTSAVLEAVKESVVAVGRP